MKKGQETFHLLYTDKDGKFQNEERSFADFNACENWLKNTGAKYWEIGFIERDIKSALKEALTT